MSTARSGSPSTSRAQGHWAVGERADGSPLALPWIRWQGGEGPHLYVGVSIHGDEVTGQASLWRLGAWLETSVLHGTVTAVPLQNPEGFNYNVRGIPGTTYDLNRAYPGDRRGGLGERITARITREAVAADAVVDVHTAGWCMPYILLDPAPDELARRTESLARATGVTVVGEFAPEQYAQERLEGLLPAVVLAAGKPSFTLELAGHGHVAWEQVEAGARALRNAARHLGIVRDEAEDVHGVPFHATDTHRRQTVRCERGGLLEYSVRPGDEIEHGHRMGRIHDVFGRVVEEIVAPAGGFVIALSATSATWAGGHVAEIAVRS